MKQLWKYLTLSLLVGLTACSSGDGREPSPTAAQASPAATAIAEAPVAARPTPTFVPTGDQPPALNPPVTGSQPPALNPPVTGSQPPASNSPVTGSQPLRLEDTAWQGGYRRASGNNTYGGRTAAWIYGSSTQFNTMQAALSLESQPAGTAQLSIEGMDSEGGAKTPIRISINGVEIFNGPNPLPDDDLPLETGTWATYTWRFDAALLRSGQNTISISNLAPGAFGRPPFFMLDYAVLEF